MYNYSPITKIKVRNFRNIGDAEIDFTKSPIVTLVGENEAGKTSIIKAFSTCALHANPRDQKDYIRDNTTMFGVEITLADGTQVVRIKENAGMNMYRVIHPDGSVWDTGKITDGLPEEVQKVMGLIDEPETNEFLHVRTYEDKLLFVVTPASTNYKVMYNALKVEQLTKAIKLGSTEVNTLKSDINRNEVSIQTLNNQLRQVKTYDLEPLLEIKDRLSSQLKTLEKLEKLNNLVDKLNRSESQLGALALINIYKLDTISEVVTSKILSANRLLNNKAEKVNCYNKLSEVNNINEISIDVITRLDNLKSKISQLNNKTIEAGSLIHIANLSDISESRVMQITKVNSLIDKLNILIKSASIIDTSQCTEISQSDIKVISTLESLKTKYQAIELKKQELTQVVDYIEKVQDYLKQCGVAVEACPKCGEAVVFDIDKLGE